MPFQPQGWINDQEAVEEVKSFMKNPFFYQAAPMIKGSGKGKLALLHLNFKKLGIPFPLRFQKIGDCVSMGTALAVDTLKVTEIVSGEREQWIAETSTEDIYYGSRVIIGGNRIRGDGSVGAWATKYIHQDKYGTLVRKKYDFGDLTIYSGPKARLWGANRDVPNGLLEEAKLHPITDYTAVQSYEDVIDSLYNGYPVIICSNQGFSSTRDSEGFARPQGSWAHCMMLIAFDDEYKRPGCLCVNSWGPTWISGPKRHDQPDGSFWMDASVVERIVRQGDSWAISGFQGFKLRPNARVI